jgi:hypothetical protein
MTKLSSFVEKAIFCYAVAMLIENTTYSGIIVLLLSYLVIDRHATSLLFNWVSSHAGLVEAITTVVLAGLAYSTLKQNQVLILENRKDRYNEDLPWVKVTSIERKEKIRADSLPADVSRHYFEVKFQNKGKGIAIMKKVILSWGEYKEDRAIESEIILSTSTYKNILFAGDEDEITEYNQPRSENYIYPLRARFEYEDRYGNLIILQARVNGQIVAPTPWLGVTRYISNEYTFPKELK